MNKDALTDRERQILERAAAGMTNQGIADELGITRNAVRYHLKEIHSKLGTGGERVALMRKRWLSGFGWLGLGLGAARVEVAGALAVGAVAIGGAGAAWLTFQHTTSDPAERACVRPADRGPCLLTVMSNSFTSSGTTIEELARLYRTTVAELQRLNPALRDGPLVAGHELIVPIPRGSGVAEAQATAGPP